jgi:[protein-PII] uridylyltransferase
MLARRAGEATAAGVERKVAVATQLRFDDSASSHSTLLELIARDRPGLIYRTSRVLAESGCNIEIALVDTEGPKAIDVFYLTSAGKKLDAARQEALHAALIAALGAV